MPSLKYWDGAVWQTLLGGPAADLSFVPLLAPAVDTRNLFLGDTAARLVLSSKVTTDTQNRLTVGADGTFSWGPGGSSALDTTLYRSAAGILKTDGQFEAGGKITELSFPGRLQGASASNSLVDANNATANGWWFAGNAAAHIPNATDWIIHVSGFNTGLLTQEARSIYTLETWRRPSPTGTWVKMMSADGSPVSPGTMFFGTAVDTNLYRAAAGQLKTDAAFYVVGVLAAHWTGSTWGVSSRAPAAGVGWDFAGDTSLYRTAPGALTLSGALTATGTLAGSGITDATLPARLRAVTTQVPGNDCNQAIEVGWYYAQPSTANSPSASTYWAIFVINDTSTTQVRQFAYDYASDVIWMRRYTAPGPWAAWVQTWPLAGTADLAYQEFIASVTLSTNVEASANTIVTAPAVTTDGVKAIRVEFFSPQVTVPQNEIAVLWLFQDGVSIGMLGYNYSTTTAGNWDTRPNLLARRLIPSAGSHTYSVRGTRNTNNATVGAGPGGAGQLTPGFIRITTA